MPAQTQKQSGAGATELTQVVTEEAEPQAAGEAHTIVKPIFVCRLWCGNA